MGLGLSLGQELNQSQKLTVRQELEQILDQKLSQQLTQHISLQQYLTQEDLITGMINWTDNNNGWKTFDREGFKFNYASLPYSIAKPIADIAGVGFAHCMYNPLERLLYGRNIALAKGEWILFTVKDKIPEGLSDYVAIHERGEELSLGNHYFASQLEWALCKKDQKTKKYIDFIDNKYPSKFVDLTQEVLFPILPQELSDYLKETNLSKNDELQLAERLIEKHPIPDNVLYLMTKYDYATTKICDDILEAVGPVQEKIHNMLIKYAKPEEIVTVLSEGLKTPILSLNRNYVDAVSAERVNEMINQYVDLTTSGLYNSLNKHFNIDRGFKKIYSNALKNKPLFYVH